MVVDPHDLAASPFGWPDTICYWTIPVGGGHMLWIKTRDEMRLAVDRTRAGAVEMFAVWPGKWRSDMFRVDDIDVLAKVLGIEATV